MDHERRNRKFATGHLKSANVECSSQKFTFYEALLTSEKGNLQIFNDTAPMSVQQSYSELCTNLDGYQVFSELSNKGFHLFESPQTDDCQSAVDCDTGKPYSLFSNLKRCFIESLVAYWDYYSYESIQKELDVIVQRPTTDLRDINTIQYDVYRPSSTFKKSKRGSPDFRVIILDSSKSTTYSHLADLGERVPVKIAVVEGGSINYLSLEPFL
jgi:hypothetical protein